MKIPSIAALVAQIPSSLGSYAPVVGEIETALASPECSLATVAEAIERDLDLTARLLRLGNSAFYGFSNRLTTVHEAVSLIGIQQVQELIQASSIVERFAGISSEFVSMESFWRHSLACGIAARLLAMEKRLPKPDKFFVAGLLHDVGRLVLFLHAPEATGAVLKLFREEKILLRQAEARVLGYDHQDIGGALLSSWQYPLPLVRAISTHHQPLTYVGAPDEALVVHVADHLVNAMQLGSSGERRVPPLQPGAWQRLELASGVLDGIVEEVDRQIEAVEDVFLKRAGQPAAA